MTWDIHLLFFWLIAPSQKKVLSNVLRVFFLTPTFPPKRKKPQLTTRHSCNWFYVLLYHCKTTKSLNQYKHKRTMYSYLKMFFFIYTLFPVLFSGLQGLIQYPKSGVRHSTSTNRSVTWMVSLLYTLCHVLNIAADTINTWFFFFRKLVSEKYHGCFQIIKSAFIFLSTVLLFFESMCQILDQEHACDFS